LLLDDWRWYEVCTFYNDTVIYKSIADPFANSTASATDEEHDEATVLPTSRATRLPLMGCPIAQNREPLICEEQAMRGCDFDDGLYPLGQSPCDVEQLRFRLKSDFFLKSNEQLRPHAEAFARDADMLATEFGLAYRKVVHLGLDRCGWNGHGCQTGTVCAASTSAANRDDGSERVVSGGSKVCVLDVEYVEEAGQGNDDSSASSSMSKKTLRIILFACAVVGLVSLTTVIVVYHKMSRLFRNISKEPEQRHDPAVGGYHSTKKASSEETTSATNTATNDDGGPYVASTDGDDDDDDDYSDSAPNGVVGNNGTSSSNTTGRVHGGWEC
jgi:hypothetical protein